MTKYKHPDEFAHVYAFAYTTQEAEAIARDANALQLTRKGKFVPGTFRVEHIPGRVPAVIGDLSGN